MLFRSAEKAGIDILQPEKLKGADIEGFDADLMGVGVLDFDKIFQVGGGHPLPPGKFCQNQVQIVQNGGIW